MRKGAALRCGTVCCSSPLSAVVSECTQEAVAAPSAPTVTRARGLVFSAPKSGQHSSASCRRATTANNKHKVWVPSSPSLRYSVILSVCETATACEHPAAICDSSGLIQAAARRRADKVKVFEPTARRFARLLVQHKKCFD